MKNFEDRLNFIIMEKFDGKKVKFAKAIGVLPSIVSEWISGKRKITRKYQSLLRLAGINPDWLLTGNGNPFILLEGNESQSSTQKNLNAVQFLNFIETNEKQAIIEDLWRKLKELEAENRVLRRLYQDSLSEIEKYKQKISELESGVEPTKKVPLVKVSEKGIAIEIKGKKK